MCVAEGAFISDVRFSAHLTPDGTGGAGGRKTKTRFCFTAGLRI